ncbi:MAG: tryptophan--tRNA ligase [Phycisphaerales bacterium]
MSTPAASRTDRPRILTGDTPTGRLHLGHWVGSVENRVNLQEKYDCYFLLANMHAFTTRADSPADIRQDTIEIVKDWLAAGIDPEKSTVVLQTEVPAIAELTWFFAMLIPFNRVMRNPTLKTEIDSKGLGDHYSFGFPMYAVGQCADILAFRPELVPVGEDQVAHIEMCREVARRFNVLYCGVDSKVEDEEFVKEGGVFPIPAALVGKTGRLIGTDGVQKMSKSLGNAIFLSDSPKQVKKKLGQIYTGRQSLDEPGDISNALFEYVRIFIKDQGRVKELEERYSKGDNIGDGHIKVEVAEAINELLEPMRERRAELEGPDGDEKVIEIIRTGTARANEVAEETLAMAKESMKLDFFARTQGEVGDGFRRLPTRGEAKRRGRGAGDPAGGGVDSSGAPAVHEDGRGRGDPCADAAGGFGWVRDRVDHLVADLRFCGDGGDAALDSAERGSCCTGTWAGRSGCCVTRRRR